MIIQRFSEDNFDYKLEVSNMKWHYPFTQPTFRSDLCSCSKFGQWRALFPNRIKTNEINKQSLLGISKPNLLQHQYESTYECDNVLILLIIGYTDLSYIYFSSLNFVSLTRRHYFSHNGWINCTLVSLDFLKIFCTRACKCVDM